MNLSPRWIRLKAVLFLLLALLGSALLVIDQPTIRTTLLLLIVIWSSCRLYYFAFYVLERYVDPTFRYSGLLSAVRFWIRR